MRPQQSGTLFTAADPTAVGVNEDGCLGRGVVSSARPRMDAAEAGGV